MYNDYMKVAKFVSVSLFAFLAVTIVLPAHARLGNDKAETARKAAKANLCENIEERINQKIILFDNTHKMHIRQYELMKKKISKTILEKDADGKNVDALRSHLAILNTKIDKFSTDRLAYLEALKEIRNYPCGDSDGAFKEAVQAAQAKHAIVIADAKDIRSYYMTTIRADLRALKD